MSYSLAFSQAIAITVFVAAKVDACMYDFVPTKEVSESLNIARPSAVKILRNLNSVGIIETREGAKGGVRLAKSPDEMTLLDIFNAIEQQRSLFKFDSNIQITNDKQARVLNNVVDALGNAQNAMKASLQNVTIAELYRENLA
jgi:Rrf2 family protein